MSWGFLLLKTVQVFFQARLAVCSQHIAGCNCRWAGLGFPALHRVRPHGRAHAAFTWYWKDRKKHYLRILQPFSHRDSTSIATMKASRCLCLFTLTQAAPESCRFRVSFHTACWWCGTKGHVTENIIWSVFIFIWMVLECVVWDSAPPRVSEGDKDTFLL